MCNGSVSKPMPNCYNRPSTLNGRLFIRRKAIIFIRTKHEAKDCLSACYANTMLRPSRLANDASKRRCVHCLIRLLQIICSTANTMRISNLPANTMLLRVGMPICCKFVSNNCMCCTLALLWPNKKGAILCRSQVWL